MLNEKIERRGQIVNGPEATIRAMLQQAHAMGANDGENAAFESILQRLQDGVCTGSEAIKEAHELLDGKQSYH